MSVIVAQDDVTCTQCNERLPSPVRHCPFCGAKAAAYADYFAQIDQAAAQRAAQQASEKAAQDKVTQERTSAQQRAADKINSLTLADNDARREPGALPPGPAGVPNQPPGWGRSRRKDDTRGAGAKPKQSQAGLWWAVGILLFVGAYFVTRPAKVNPQCKVELTAAADALATSDGFTARTAALQAQTLCSGEDRAKATELLAAADKALVGVAACEKAFRSVTTQLQLRQLVSARRTLDEMNTSCAESKFAVQTRSDIDKSIAAGNNIEEEVRRWIRLGDGKAAKEALDRLVALNREHPGIEEMRKDVNTLLGPQQAPTGSDGAASAPASGPNSGPFGTSPMGSSQPPTAVKPPAAASTPAPAPEPKKLDAFAQQKIRGYLTEAEAAASRGLFDVARSYLNSARQVDPNHPDIEAMEKKINNMERGTGGS